MSKIKFRAYMRNVKKMFPVCSLELSNLEEEPIGVASCGNVNCGTCIDFYESQQVELMQTINGSDKNGRELFEDDLVKLILPDGEVRIFRIRIKTVDREVRNHPEFLGEYSKVRITAVVFEWQGFDLFPCVDENGVSDISKMEWAGTFWENPELLEVEK